MITFKTKAKNVVNRETRAVAYQYVTVPRITRNHCDMSKFRLSKEYGHIANSDMFEGSINRKIRVRLGVHRDLWDEPLTLHLDQLPDWITVEPGFLHTVKVNLLGE
jgi:hypothetical protein